MPAVAHRLRSAARSLPQRIRLLVVESGASPLRGEGSEDFDETLAIAQTRDESPIAFAQRVLERLALAERSGRRFESAVISTGRHHDAASRAARRLVALGLAAHGAAHANSCELELEANRDASHEARAALLELVEELVAASPECRAVPVRLRFREGSRPSPEPKSGTFSIVTE